MAQLVVRLLLIVLFVAALSCSDAHENPLIGEWKADASQLPAGANPTAEQLEQTLIEFTETSMISQGQVTGVTYEVLEDKVIVTGVDGKGMEFGVTDRDRIVMPKTIISPEIHLVRK